MLQHILMGLVLNIMLNEIKEFIGNRYIITNNMDTFAMDLLISWLIKKS